MFSGKTFLRENEVRLPCGSARMLAGGHTAIYNGAGKPICLGHHGDCKKEILAD